MTTKYQNNKALMYKGWDISYNQKPIPLRHHDYDVTHKDYDGQESNLHFTASSIDDAKRVIDREFYDAAIG